LKYKDDGKEHQREIKNMAAIHLIKNDPGLPQITPIAQGADIFRSGYWVMAEATANALIGGKIFFHKEQAGPSFFGGVIMSTEKVVSGEYAGRIVFIFKSDQACKGITTPRDGWAQEMKIIL
jgi:hypothetical protein